MIKNNKKGISAIVATVLIILITVAAVTIIWAAIIPMIQGNLESGQACLDAAAQVKIKNAGYTCVQTGRCQMAAGNAADAASPLCHSNQTYCEAAANACGGSGTAGVWNASSGLVSLQVGVGSGDMILKDVQVRVYADGNTVNADNMDNLSTMSSKGVPGANEEKTYLLTVGSDLVTANVATINKVEIAPVVGKGATEHVCDVSSEVDLKPCA